MNRFHCLGLVGGLGVGATIHYYKKLAEAHEVQGRTLDIVIAHAQTSRVFEYVQSGDSEGLAEYLAGFIHRLQVAGASLAAIPAVTPHFCLKELRATSPIPVVDIIEPLIREVASRAVKRIAVFGTRFVMESRLFGQVDAVEFVQLRGTDLDFVHNTYLELARTGRASRDQHQRLTALAQKICELDGADAIVMAGTDLAVLFDGTQPAFPHIDCAGLHIHAILEQMDIQTRAA